MSHNKLHCRCYTCPECQISTPSHTLSNCMGPPHSPSRITSPTGWTSSSDEPTSPLHYHPYHIRGRPQGIHVKKSQGTSPLFSPRRNLSPSLDVAEPSPPPVTSTMTPPSSPLGNPNSLPPTLWNLDDPCIPILHSIGFTVDGWSFPDGLPTWEQVRVYEHQHLHGVTFDLLAELDCIHERQHLCSVSFGSED